MDYITEKINSIDDLIRHDKKIDQNKKDEILQTLQLIHFRVKLVMEMLERTDLND